MKDLKIKMADTAAKVQYALGWTDQQYADFQFEQGYAYLKYWIGEDVFGYRELPLTASFWAWWRNHWHKRDVRFLHVSSGMPLREKTRCYRLIHSPGEIQYTPQSAIMHDAYAKMIYQLTHQEATV